MFKLGGKNLFLLVVVTATCLLVAGIAYYNFTRVPAPPDVTISDKPLNEQPAIRFNLTGTIKELRTAGFTLTPDSAGDREVLGENIEISTDGVTQFFLEEGSVPPLRQGRLEIGDQVLVSFKNPIASGGGLTAATVAVTGKINADGQVDLNRRALIYDEPPAVFNAAGRVMEFDGRVLTIKDAEDRVLKASLSDATLIFNSGVLQEPADYADILTVGTEVLLGATENIQDQAEFLVATVNIF